MRSNIKKTNTNTGVVSPPEIQNTILGSPDPQVQTKSPRRTKRKLTQAYKDRMIASYEAGSVEERGALLRREGLYSASISRWKREKLGTPMEGRRKGKKALRVDHLTQENAQLKRKLAQAEAVIELQKKVSDLFGGHILPHENSETNW